MKIIIVGGVAGGMSAATRLRRLLEDAEIIVIDKGPYVSFANCGLPYHVSGEIEARQSLILQTPESLNARFNLDVRVNSEVTEIDHHNKQVTIHSQGEQYQESFDKLILSPGAKPFVPPIKGLDEANNVYSLRNVPDLDQIMAAINQLSSKNATVIGAGFIGLEMAESLKMRGLNVTIIEKAPHVLPTFDQEMAAFVEQELIKHDIQLFTGCSANEFKDQGKTIVLDNGQEIATDLIILSVGVQPDTDLAKNAGIELGMRGGIVVDEQYQTNLPDIYAVGDAIIVNHQITNQDTMIALASPANRQGRQVADIIAGQTRSNLGSIGTSIVRVFDLAAAATGLSERMAREQFDNINVVHLLAQDHASYFPGSTPIQLKLIFDQKTGRILGAQAVGTKGVDKRIDVIATAIKGQLTVVDLPELELTYAPPFGAAKDPVNMIGYMALNLFEGLTEIVQWNEVMDLLNQGAMIIDTRNPDELAAGRINHPRVLNIPVNVTRQHLPELDKDILYILLCRSGVRSYISERILKQAGFKAKNIDGGYALFSVVNPKDTCHD